MAKRSRHFRSLGAQRTYVLLIVLTAVGGAIAVSTLHPSMLGTIGLLTAAACFNGIALLLLVTRKDPGSTAG